MKYTPSAWAAFDAYARDHRENLVTMVGNALSVIDSWKVAQIPRELMRDVIVGAGQAFIFHGGDMAKGIDLRKLSKNIDAAGAPHAAQFIRDLALYIEQQRTGKDTPPATPKAIAAVK